MPVPSRIARRAGLLFVLAIVACGGQPGGLATVTTPAATTLSIDGGNGQLVAAGGTASVALTVKVLDQSGTALAGIAVTWTVTSGSGSVSPATSTTNDAGIAGTTFTAGTVSGTAIVSAAAAGVTSANFTITVTGGTAPVGCAAETTTTGSVVCLVSAFKATLSSSQQSSVQLALTSANAIRWSHLPCGSACRNGLQFSGLSAVQLAGALQVARAALGPNGYATFDAIRKADTFLGTQGASAYGEGNYFIAFLGTPSTTGTWILQLGGHHHAANVTFAGGTTAASVTPNFVGVEPQSFALAGTAYAPLQARRVAMYAMINSLDATQRDAAQLATSGDDVLLGPNRDGQFPVRQGQLVSALTAPQQALVKAAIDAWIGDAPPDLAAVLAADYESATAYATTRVAWSRSTDSTVAGSYVRIDGPKVWIELVAQTGVVFPSRIRYHTIWRDKSRDYGGQFRF